MAIYNVNQNRQFYVVTEVVTDAEPTSVGQIKLTNINNEQFFLKHFGQGGLTRTDIIDKANVTYAKWTEKSKMRRKLKKATVTFRSEALDEGKPIAGQDYLLRIQVNNYLSPGDASVLIRSGVVHATRDMTVDELCDKMVESLTKNFSRDPHPLLSFAKEPGSEGSTASITITEVGDQPWRLGVLSQASVNFEVIPTTVRFEGEDVIWGEAKYGVTSDYVGNGKELADLEYFCQAERGDMFRNMGWPNNIDVKYMVDPSKEYDVLDIHYYYSGDGVQVHKSEKDITFVAETSVMTKLKTAIEGAGVTIK